MRVDEGSALGAKVIDAQPAVGKLPKSDVLRRNRGVVERQVYTRIAADHEPIAGYLD